MGRARADGAEAEKNAAEIKWSVIFVSNPREGEKERYPETELATQMDYFSHGCLRNEFLHYKKRERELSLRCALQKF